MEAETLLNSIISVTGTLFVEVMAGECVITFGDERVPCLKPSDIVFGEAWNVLKDKSTLL